MRGQDLEMTGLITVGGKEKEGLWVDYDLNRRKQSRLTLHTKTPHYNYVCGLNTL